MPDDPAIPPGSRRSFLARSAGIAAGAAALSTLPRPSLRAAPQAMQELIRKVVGEAPLRTGKVRLDVPPLVENGNAVSLIVSVDSPMTPAEHVKAIHIVNEKNPQPHVISVTLGPSAGRARVSTRIKLADSQRIMALAQMSDGSFWIASADVIVALAACLEDLRQ
jgi:sulfur-oxidizing protein SoxY